MNAITIELPEELIKQMELLASEQGISVSDVYLAVTRDILSQHDAEKRFRTRAERGRAIKDRALELLRRE